MKTVIVRRYKTPDGFGYGVWEIFETGKKIYKNRKAGRNHIDQCTGGQYSVKTRNQALNLIKRFGELRGNEKFKNILLSGM